ncbi:YlcI/YnfO family protein [Burkholderia multivorans]|uniref:YlcI/YnfO family protein n=1 Tax=Burkholderia multivorans TaxID=87883 RepID=UPI002870515C|nr:YlcI/YnfO family protein [Burkholderia multivorans]
MDLCAGRVYTLLHRNCDGQEITIKTATLPSLRLEPELREGAENEPQEGETLSGFVEQSTREGIERQCLPRESLPVTSHRATNPASTCLRGKCWRDWSSGSTLCVTRRSTLDDVRGTLDDVRGTLHDRGSGRSLSTVCVRRAWRRCGCRASRARIDGHRFRHCHAPNRDRSPVTTSIRPSSFLVSGN